MKMSKTIEIRRDTAELVDRVFLPRNPNKLRGADPTVIAAAHAFRAAVASGAATGATETALREVLQIIEEYGLVKHITSASDLARLNRAYLVLER